MPLSVAALARPAFFSRNWINQDAIDYGTFTATEMAGILSRIIDGDPLSYWADSSATDGTTVTITVSLNQRGLTPGRSIDLLLFQNINWKNFIVKYSTDGGATYNTVPGGDYSNGVQNYAAADLALALGTTLTGVTHLQVSITHTQTPNQNKQLGGWIAAQLVLQPAVGAVIVPGYRENVNTVVLGDKNESDEYVLRSAQTYLWWGASLTFRGLTRAEADTLFTIKTGGLPFILYPEPGERVRDCYLCRFGPGWAPKFLSDGYKAAGILLALEVREVRG